MCGSCRVSIPRDLRWLGIILHDIYNIAVRGRRTKANGKVSGAWEGKEGMYCTVGGKTQEKLSGRKEIMVEYCKHQQVGHTVRSGRTEILVGKLLELAGRK